MTITSRDCRPASTRTDIRNCLWAARLNKEKQAETQATIAELQGNKKQLDEGIAAIEQGEAEFAKHYQELDSARAQLDDAKKQLDDGRKKYVSQAQKIGEVAAFAPLREWELNAFIEEYVRSKGGSIDRKSSSMVAEHVGSDLKRLKSEIDKVFVTFAPDAPKNITASLVERCIGISKDFNSFELRDAIVAHNIEKANLIVKHLMGDPRSGGLFAMIPTLFSYFQNLMLAHYAPAPRDASAIMSYLGLRSEFATKAYTEGMKHYSPMKTIQISLNSIDKVKAFVNDITRFDNDFDLVSGRYVIDAKSIMGIFSLDLSKPIDLSIHAEENLNEILEILKPYMI